MHLTIQSPYISAALQQKLRAENGQYYKIRLQCDLSLWIMVVFLHTSSPLLQFLLFLTEKLVCMLTSRLLGYTPSLSQCVLHLV